MTFRIGDNTVSKNVTLEQLTAGLDAVNDRKKIDRITQIFEQYNTNTNSNSVNTLDIDEQVTLMNDLHRADGDGNGRDFDGKVSRRGLKKAGLTGDYKAYRDFIEAYQRVVAADVNTYELNFDDGTVEGKQFVETRAVQQGETTTTEYKYNDLSGATTRVLTTQSDEEGARSYDQHRRLTRQVVDGTTIQYRAFTSDARNANPGIITVRQEGVDGMMLVKLQDDGTYLDETENSHYRLNRSGFLDGFTVDEQNRVTAEVFGENTFNYTYEGEAPEPASVTINQGEQNEVTFTRENELYTSMNNETKEYFEFDSEKREFTQTDAPKPIEQPVEKQLRPKSQKLIRMTNGWRGQRVKLDETTTEEFNAMSKANEILTELVAKNEQYKNANLNTEILLADLIKNNPSVFNEKGIIYSDARWNRLDFPSDLSRYVVQ